MSISKEEIARSAKIGDEPIQFIPIYQQRTWGGRNIEQSGHYVDEVKIRLAGNFPLGREAFGANAQSTGRQCRPRWRTS